MASIEVNLNDTTDPCIEIVKSDTLTEYVRKENIANVSTFSATGLRAKTGAARDEVYIVTIEMNNGSRVSFDVQDVSNQVTWLASDAGLVVAAGDISQAT